MTVLVGSNSRIDDQPKALIASAPPGVKLSAWHEASNLKSYPDYVRSDRNMSAVHQYLRDLCQGSRDQQPEAATTQGHHEQVLRYSSAIPSASKK